MKCFALSGNPCMRFFCCVIVIFITLYPVSRAAAQLAITPMLNVSETFTDNVAIGLTQGVGGGGLGGVGSGGLGLGGFGFGTAAKRTDLITQINPGVTIQGTGQRFDLNAQYVMNNLIFARNSNLTRIRHMLNANGNAEIIRDLLFVEGSALISQQNIGLLGAQTDSNVFATGNRGTIQVYSVSPFLRYRFQDFATTEIRYSRNIVKSGVFGFRDSQRNGFQFGLNSGSSFTKVGWGVNYSNQMIHLNGVNREIEMERSIANLQYFLTRRLSLTASGGYERNSFISIRGRPSSPTWSAGFVWKPNPRTDMQFSVGQRFFGDTYSGEINYRRRLMDFRVLYAEEITTFNQQAGSFGAFGGLDTNFFSGLGLQDMLALNNFLTNRVFLQRRFNASVSLNGSRNNLALNLFGIARTPYSDAELDDDLIGLGNRFLFNRTKQMGGNVSWNYKLSSHTDLLTTFSFLRFDFSGSNGTNDNLIFSTSLNRNFDSNLRGSLEYRRIDRISSAQSTSVAQSANAVTVSLTKNF